MEVKRVGATEREQKNINVPGIPTTLWNKYLNIHSFQGSVPILYRIEDVVESGTESGVLSVG